MYSVPENQIPAMEQRFKETVSAMEMSIAVKKEAESKSAETGVPVAPETKFMKIDLESAPLAAQPRSEKEALIMKSMGITPAMDNFFSTTIIFENFRNKKVAQISSCNLFYLKRFYLK